MSEPPRKTEPKTSKEPPGASHEALETVEAIQRGNVDAVVVQGPEGPRVVMLQGADEPYRVLVERMSDGALTLGPEGRILFANRRLSDLTGLPSEELVGKRFASLFVGEAPAGQESAATEAQLRRHAVSLPVSVWMSQIALAGVSATLVTITDLSVQRHAEAVAIAERFARSILEQATDAIVVLTPNGRITHASALAERLALAPPVGRMFSDVLPVDAQSSTQALTLARFSHETLDEALATKPFHGVEVKLRTPRLESRSFLLSAGPLTNDAKQSVGAIVTLTEITDRKRAEEQQTVLVAELNHRVKNILAVVQAVASQTVRASPSLASFKATFAGRIQALSIAHDVLTRTRWFGIGLGELLAAVLAPYRSDGRIALAGPPVLLPARVIVPLSMGLHELATNASKYGALSVPGGGVSIQWSVAENGKSQVGLVWSEHDGPRVDPARTDGFGTRLIQRVIEHDLEGRAELTFAAEGLRAALSFPLRTSAELNDLAGAAKH